MNTTDKKIKIWTYSVNYYKKSDKEKIQDMKDFFNRLGYTNYINVIADENDVMHTQFVVECYDSDFSIISEYFYFWGVDLDNCTDIK